MKRLEELIADAVARGFTVSFEPHPNTIGIRAKRGAEEYGIAYPPATFDTPAMLNGFEKFLREQEVAA